MTICKVSSPPSPASPDKNQARITSDTGDDTVTLPSANEDQNHAQITKGDSSYASDDTLHTVKETKGSIYRLGDSDLFGCKDCKILADRIFMESHDCSGWK